MPYTLPPQLIQPAQAMPSLSFVFRGDADAIARLQAAAADKGVQLTPPRDDGGQQVVQVAPGQNFVAVMSLVTAAKNGAYGPIATQTNPPPAQ
jgi:hypothetical protein